MKRSKTLSLAVVISLVGMVGTQSAIAAGTMPNTPDNVSRVMDYNKDGTIDRNEYLRYHGNKFDAMAGKQGFATSAQVSRMMSFLELQEFQGSGGD